MIHAHSIAAYREEQDAGRISNRYGQIINVIGDREMTDREIMKALGFTDPNTVRPRVTELIKAGILQEYGFTLDSETGKRVRVVRITPKAPGKQEELF